MLKFNVYDPLRSTYRTVKRSRTILDNHKNLSRGPLKTAVFTALNLFTALSFVPVIEMITCHIIKIWGSLNLNLVFRSTIMTLVIARGRKVST